MTSFPYSESTALLTGASRGIGAALAHALAKRAIKTLILTARSQHDLESLASELFAAYGTRVETIVADLSLPTASATIYEETQRRGLAVDLLINNAGFGTHGTFEQSEPGRNRAMVEVNIQALVELSHCYLKSMIANNRGGVVNIASTASFQPVPYMSVYAATKAFVLSFTEGLAVEVADSRADEVRILALCPGGTTTNFGDGMLRGRFENARQDSPDVVAEATLAALDHHKTVEVVGTRNYLMTLSTRIAPRRTVAEIAGSLFRPETETAGTRQRKQERKGIIAVTAGLALVAISALYLARRNQSRSA